MDRFDIEALRDNAKELTHNFRNYRTDAKDQADLLLQRLKLQNYMDQKREDEKLKKLFLSILTVIGIIASIACIAYAVYRFVAPDYLEDYDDYEDPEEDDDVVVED